jgi:hypothetical protein
MGKIGPNCHHMVLPRPTKYAEIIEDEDTNIRRRKVTDKNK